jgi:molybdopterin-guanine dinucleotide biosynthesis protein A
MKQLFESGNYCIHDFYFQVQVRFVPSEALARLDEVGRSFMNINTPEDFERMGKEIST